MPFKNSVKQSAPNKSTLDSFISLGVGFSCRVGANVHVFLPKISCVVRCVWTLAERWLRGWTEAKGFLHKSQQETWYKATRNHDWRQTKVTSVYSRKRTHTHMHTQVQRWQSDAFWASLSAISSQQQIFCSLGQMTLRTTDSCCTALGCLISTLDRKLQTYRRKEMIVWPLFVKSERWSKTSCNSALKKLGKQFIRNTMHMLVHTVIQSASHEAAIEWPKSCRYRTGKADTIWVTLTGGTTVAGI